MIVFVNFIFTLFVYILMQCSDHNCKIITCFYKNKIIHNLGASSLWPLVLALGVDPRASPVLGHWAMLMALATAILHLDNDYYC